VLVSKFCRRWFLGDDNLKNTLLKYTGIRVFSYPMKGLYARQIEIFNVSYVYVRKHILNYASTAEIAAEIN